nr:hypothetical protein [Tanacetum cinerariifolium]
ELEPHLAYDFFAPALLPGYAGVTEPVAEAEEEQVIAPVVDIEEGQIDVLMIDMEEKLVMLFGEDDDFEDDDSEGFDEEEAWEVSDAEVAASVTIGELGLRIYAVEGHVLVMASQMVHAADRWEQVQALQIDVQQRDTQIQQLQSTVTEMGSRESTLMQ